MMKSRCCLPSAAAELITEAPLSLDDVVRAVGGPEHGAVVAFAGCVRAAEEGRPLEALEYEAYASMAARQLEALLAEARRTWAVRAAARHRIGVVPAGEAAVVIACSAPHRREAFEAAQFLLERLKRDVPIWKVGFRWL